MTKDELKDIASDVADCRPVGFVQIFKLLRYIEELERERNALLRAVGIYRGGNEQPAAAKHMPPDGDFKHDNSALKAAEARAERLWEVLEQAGDAICNVFEQMEKGSWRDEYDHPVRNNTAMLQLKDTLHTMICLRAMEDEKQ
jgi:uncharacterized protein YdcH (DUF465 family)